MIAKRFETLEKAIDSIEAACIAINVQKGSSLFEELRSMERRKPMDTDSTTAFNQQRE